MSLMIEVTRWLTNRNRGCGHFSHNSWSSCEYVIDDRGEDLVLIEWLYTFLYLC
jgi:hypothetical protein